MYLKWKRIMGGEKMTQRNCGGTVNQRVKCKNIVTMMLTQVMLGNASVQSVHVRRPSSNTLESTLLRTDTSSRLYFLRS